MDKTEYFIEIFTLAEKKYGNDQKRLAADGWKEPWQMLITTVMSAQSRDETTIPIAESLFIKYSTLEKLSKAKYSDVLKILKSLNYNKTKSKNVIAAADFIIKNFNGKVPETIDELIQIPGVGRKTGNLVLSEVFKKDGICVDTHVHRISNVINLVKTKNPKETEFALMKIAPKEYWGKINRLLVLWGKEVPGKNKEKLLDKINYS